MLGTAGQHPINTTNCNPCSLSFRQKSLHRDYWWHRCKNESYNRLFTVYCNASIPKHWHKVQHRNFKERVLSKRRRHIVRLEISPCKTPNTLDLLNIHYVEPKIASVCSQLPKHVSERQISSALLKLEKNGVRCNSYSSSFERSLSPGSSILVHSESDFGYLYRRRFNR